MYKLEKIIKTKKLEYILYRNLDKDKIIKNTEKYLQEVFDNFCDKNKDIYKYENKVSYDLNKESAVIDSSIVFSKPIEYIEFEISRDMFSNMSDEQFKLFIEGLKEYIESGEYEKDID